MYINDESVQETEPRNAGGALSTASNEASVAGFPVYGSEIPALHAAGDISTLWSGSPTRSYDADILILSLDRIDDTLAAIRSALGQTGVSTRLFVLDQGSTAVGLMRLAEALRGVSNATLIASRRNLGVPGGRNLLSGLGCGRVIAVLDNDAEFATSDTLARLVRALDDDPHLAAIGCRIMGIEGHDDLSSWGYPASLLPSAGQSFDAATFVGAGHALRRDAWEQTGGYDSRLFFCWEEFDFCLRAIALGWRIRYRGDIVIHHKVSAESRVEWSALRWFYHVRNRLYIERKLGRRWLHILPRVAAYCVKGTLNGVPLQTLRAVLAAVAMAPHHRRRNPPIAIESYLKQHDRVYRGSVVRRFKHEVLGRIGAPGGVVPAAE